MKLQRFNTNLASPLNSNYPELPYKGRGWHVTFGSKLKLEDGTIEYSDVNGKLRTPKHIIIHAANEETAQNALDLILAASCIVNEDCNSGLLFDNMRVFRWDKDHVKKKTTYNVDSQLMVDRYQFACLIAARASRRKSFQYALVKYRLSQQCFNTHIDFLEPNKWMPQKYVFNSAQHHVRCAQAVALGYSVIEELGLEIRADQRNPSFIKGAWNQNVKEELEQRLVKSGIDLSEKALWTMRDTPTKLERKRPIPVVEKSSWAFSKVRDSDIEVIDAIALASWMRSKVSAHRLHEISASLNYYDVSNIHYLSRRLLLESLGLWHSKGFPR